MVKLTLQTYNINYNSLIEDKTKLEIVLKSATFRGRIKKYNRLFFFVKAMNVYV